MVLFRARLLIAAFALAGASAQAQSEPALVRAGIPAYYEGFLPVYTALDKGYFKDENLKVEILRFGGGGPAGQAFVAGSIDLCLCSFDHVLKLQSKGLDAVAVGGIEEYNAYALVARPRAIKDGMKGLKGKKIGITAPGSATDIVVRYGLKKAGVDVKDVTIVSLGGATAMKAALERNQVDAGMVIGGTLVEMLSEGWEAVVDFRKDRYPLEVVSARRSWLGRNGDVARRFMRALVRAERELQSDPKTALEMTKVMFPKIDDKLVGGIAEAAVRRLSPDGSIHEEGVQNIIEQQVFAGTVPRALPYETLVDLSYLPKTGVR